jgi:hypothetical protein
MDNSIKIRRGDGYSIIGNAIFKALGRFSGHARPLDRQQDQRPRHRRHQSMTMAAAETATATERGEPLRRSKTNFQPPPACPHLPPRTHSLTPVPVPLDNVIPELDEQTQSALFKLPEELLLLIYEEVIGRRTFHIVRRSHRLGHTTCHYNTPGSQEECKEGGCRGLKVPSGLHIESGPGHGGLIQLLQTCRKM